MNKRTNILLWVVTALILYFCVGYPRSVVRVTFFLVAVFWIFVSWWLLFDRIKLGDKWFKSHTGKAGFPGSVRACIVSGLVALGVACVFIFCGFRL